MKGTLSNKYKMNHQNRGKAYIFNYYKFNDLLTIREGTKLDEERLRFVLSKYYGFEIRVCTDYTQGKIYNALWKASNEDYSNCDCILVVVMSHGEEGRLYAKDTVYKVEDLWTPFIKCASLEGKPKIFLIQSFWGTGEKSWNDPNPICKFSIPSSPDMLIMYSTFEGYYAVKSTKIVGSWFIQHFCDELESTESCNNDLVQILTRVNSLKGKCCGLVRSRQQTHNQVGVIISSLTGPIYLTRKT